MGKRDWLKWLHAALVRALKTFAQTAAAGITVGAALSEIDWPRILSVSAVSFVASMFTSLAGLPEVPEKEPPLPSEGADDIE